ncbi:hypothetical protein C4M95_04930, partial [Mycoplasmopsis pullorum]
TYANSLGSASWIGNALQFNWKITEGELAYYSKLPYNFVIHATMSNGVKMVIGNLITSIVAIVSTVIWTKTLGKKEFQKWIAQ